MEEKVSTENTSKETKENENLEKSLETLENEMENDLEDDNGLRFSVEPKPETKRSIIQILFRHQFIRFIFSSILGSIIFYLLYELTFSVLSFSSIQNIQIYKASIAWLFCYIISIWFQHGLHQAIVFYDENISYLKSLFWTYFAYSLSILVTPIFIYLLTASGIHHRISWLIGLIVTGIFNYFSMKCSFWCSRKIDSEYRRIYKVDDDEEDEAEGLLVENKSDNEIEIETEQKKKEEV